MAIGFWSSRKVKTETDFFLGGRRFGKGLLIMHWLCTGTHSEMAVQVAGATARVGLGGIWYQWMWLFSTPFYWLMAPVTRRLRVTTTGDFFRIRYGRSLEMLYALVGLFYFGLSIALLLRGAGAAISGATGGAVPTEASVIALAVLFSTYVMAGGLVAAVYTDLLQGLMIIVLSFCSCPPGLGVVGGLSGLHDKLGPAMFAITAPPGAREGDPWFVVTMSVLGLVGFVVQPHVMTATGSGKTETEARVGMVYGNFIKRLLTIAWAFTGLIALAAFPAVIAGLDPNSPQARHASETLFGRAIQHFLGDGWRGLMIACLIAGVTSARPSWSAAPPSSPAISTSTRSRADPTRITSGSGGWPRADCWRWDPAGGAGRECHPARARLGQADRLARGGLLAGRGLATCQRGGGLGQLSGEPPRLGRHERGIRRHRDPGRRSGRWSRPGRGRLARAARFERAGAGHHHAGGRIRADDPGQPGHPASRPIRARPVLRPAAHAGRQGRRGSLGRAAR